MIHPKGAFAFEVAPCHAKAVTADWREARAESQWQRPTHGAYTPSIAGAIGTANGAAAGGARGGALGTCELVRLATGIRSIRSPFRISMARAVRLHLLSLQSRLAGGCLSVSRIRSDSTGRNPQRRHSLTSASCSPQLSPMRSFLSLTVACVLLLLASSIPASAFTGGSPTILDHAPLIRSANRTSVRPNQFMVQTDSNVSTHLLIDGGLADAFAALTKPNILSLAPFPTGLVVRFDILYTYDSAITGFTLKLRVNQSVGVLFPPLYPTVDAVLAFATDVLLRQPGILQVEEDCELFTTALQYEEVSGNALWHLDRVDQRQNAGDDRYYFNSTASNVHAYVVDTGIRISHKDFGNRASWDFNAFSNDKPVNAQDGQGHGTHVAGTVGSTTYGLAKQVRLHAVKVLSDNGAGTDSSVTAGLDWIARNKQFPAVAVMSLGGGISSTLDTAVKNLVNAGVSVVVAAGNSAETACNSSPAHVDVAITVSASDINDKRASFSNYGPCSTLFAPGVSITSLSNADDTSTRVLSGTSMAAPHVAGAVALYLAQHPSALPAQVKSDLICYSTKDAISDAQGTPNRFLYSFITQGDPVAERNGGGTAPILPPTTTTSPDSNSQSEKCTSASPCEGPFTPMISSAGGRAVFAYNTSAAGGFHRAWLSYNAGSAGLLGRDPVAQNSLSLQRYNDRMGAWETLASDSGSSSSKSIAFEDTSTSPAAGATWAWVVTAQGKTPTAINLTFKRPAAPVAQPAQPAPTRADQCSATSYFDPKSVWNKSKQAMQHTHAYMQRLSMSQANTWRMHHRASCSPLPVAWLSLSVQI